MRDLKIDPSTDDLVVDNYDLVIVETTEQIAQRIRTRLRTFFAEWFLDTRVGIPFLDYVFIQNPDIFIIESLYKEQILTTPEVNSLIEFSLEFNRETRIATIEFRADTTYGVIG